MTKISNNNKINQNTNSTIMVEEEEVDLNHPFTKQTQEISLM